MRLQKVLMWAPHFSFNSRRVEKADYAKGQIRGLLKYNPIVLELDGYGILVKQRLGEGWQRWE